MVAAESRKLPADVPTDDEVKALIAVCSKRAPTGIRNRAMIAVMWRCGLRISEALALKPADVQLDESGGELLVKHGKGDKSRRLGVDATTAAMLQRWIDRRAALGFNGRQTLFCTLDGKPLQQSYVRHLLPRLALKANVERRVHAHGLRHAFAARKAKIGTPIDELRDALGHSSLAMTDRYLRSIAPVDVIRMMQADDWTL